MNTEQRALLDSYLARWNPDSSGRVSNTHRYWFSAYWYNNETVYLEGLVSSWNEEKFHEVYSELLYDCMRFGLHVKMSGTTTSAVPSQFYIYSEVVDDDFIRVRYGSTRLWRRMVPNCLSCGRLSRYKPFHESCGRPETSCTVCSQGWAGQETTPNSTPSNWTCTSCVTYCTWENCDALSTHTEFQRCENHVSAEYGIQLCNGCHRTILEENGHFGVAGREEWLCHRCHALLPVCDECGTLIPHEEYRSHPDDPYQETVVCVTCYDRLNAGRVETLVWIPEAEPVSTNTVRVASLDDRPARSISIEQEIVLTMPNARACARTLRELGLSPWESVEGYHSSGHNMFCHMEHDSSIAGAELIYNRMNLAEDEDTANLMLALTTVQDYEPTWDATTGMHMHIDLHGLSLQDVKNIVVVYSFLEDVIYRLGSAGYPQHRTLIRGGRNYAQAIQKHEYASAKEFGMKFLRQASHADSLNMQHFYNSMRHCSCGAYEFGSGIDQCECNRGKVTAEWRVFNGTGHPRRIRAWAALVQAVTAWSQDRNLQTLAAQEGYLRPFTFNTANRTLPEFVSRVEWMFTHLPLTDAEQEDLAWCLNECDTGFSAQPVDFNVYRKLYEPERELPTPPPYGFREYSGSPLDGASFTTPSSRYGTSFTDEDYDGPDEEVY